MQNFCKRCEHKLVIEMMTKLKNKQRREARMT